MLFFQFKQEADFINADKIYFINVHGSIISISLSEDTDKGLVYVYSSEQEANEVFSRFESVIDSRTRSVRRVWWKV